MGKKKTEHLNYCEVDHDKQNTVTMEVTFAFPSTLFRFFVRQFLVFHLQPVPHLLHDLSLNCLPQLGP